MTNNQETINTILIDVLKGVKETGSELYAAGKAGVAQAVDSMYVILKKVPYEDTRVAA